MFKNSLQEVQKKLTNVEKASELAIHTLENVKEIVLLISDYPEEFLEFKNEISAAIGGFNGTSKKPEVETGEAIKLTATTNPRVFTNGESIYIHFDRRFVKDGSNASSVKDWKFKLEPIAQSVEITKNPNGVGYYLKLEDLILENALQEILKYDYTLNYMQQQKDSENTNGKVLITAGGEEE